MTEEGVPARAVRTIIPAFAGMTEEGVPARAVRTIIPTFAGMTGEWHRGIACHSREACPREGGERESMGFAATDRRRG